MLYGANGYTGRLIAEEAAKRGAPVLLAGRNTAEIEKLGQQTGLPARIFALDEIEKVAGQLSDVVAVLNCAGPFSKTAPMLMEACLRAKVHYLDITGEIDVIEAAAALDARSREAAVTILPAVGFDVVPSDCLAAILKDKLPTATHLILAFTASGALSPGTTKTLLEVMPTGGRARIAGKIQRVPADWKRRAIPFPSGTREAVTIPWGDVASAYYSTGIENIETYLASSPTLAQQSNLLRRISWLLRSHFIRERAQRWIGKTVSGPSAEARTRSRAELWGQVSDAAGNVAEASLETPNGYSLTVDSALAAVERILAGGVATGFQTPSKAFGKDFIVTIPGTRLIP